MIDRRKILKALAALPFASQGHAQKRLLLAILSPASRDAEVLKLVNEPFKQGLAKLGWDAGRNIEIAERFADRDEARLPALAAELVALGPYVIFTNTSAAATIVARTTQSIPIVVGPAGEMVLTALAGGSIARPTTNVTGFVLTAPVIDDKGITLLMEAVPSATRIGVLVNPNNPGQQLYPAALSGAFSVAGKTLVRIEAQGLADIDAALTKAATEHIEALFIGDDSHIAADPEVRQRVLRFTMSARIPVASSHLGFARDGALLVMGPSIPALAASAAGYVDKILRGATPRDLPVQLPSTFTIIVNLVTAKTLGVTLPPTILLRANEVIE